MAITIVGAKLNVQPGKPIFNFLTNLCNWFELGNQVGNDLWLEGKIIEGEFIFNGRLFLHNGSAGLVIDSFPKGPVPQGWTKKVSLHREGYSLVDDRNETIFAYHVEQYVCFVDVNLYNSSGQLAITPGQGGMVIKFPFKAG